MDINENYEIFLSVIETNKGIIYKIANSFYSNQEDRKDLIQEIILKLWQTFDRYNDEYKHSTWIYRISLNVSISLFRKERTRSKLNAEFSGNIFQLADFQGNNQQEEKYSSLNRFISELRELDRALLLLYFEEKSHKEISEIMGISETNVATKISRIKLKLKQKFSQLKKAV